MQTVLSFNGSSSLTLYPRLLAVLALGMVIYGMNPPAARAEVIAVGDVDPDEDPALPIFGGETSGSVTVGQTGIGRLVIDVPAFTLPLISQGAASGDVGAIIGEEDTAIGEVVITGFGSEWQVRGSGIIGDRGLAFLSLIAGARFTSANEVEDNNPVPGTAVLVMGNEAGSSAITTVDGFGSRLQSAYLLAGREGDASIDIINRGNVITTFDAAIGVTDPNDFTNINFPNLPALDQPSNSPRPSGRVTLTGLGSRWTVQDSLVIGNDGTDDETGVGILQIGNQALVQVGTLDSTDRLIINRLGRVELTGGTLRALTGTSSNPQPILNDGVIKGNGFVDGSILNTGEIRNAASIANQREIMLVSGEVVNSNLIESLGGEMEFLAPVDNTGNGDMIFRDAVIRFQGGVTNNGELALGGDTTLYGDIDTSDTFIVLPDSTALIRGNISFNPGAVAAFTVGSMTGTLDVIGTATLSDALLSLDYSAGGVKAQPGDTYDLFTAHGGLMGMFGNTQAVADGLLWDINYSATTVSVTATGLTAMPLGADFNGDGIVNALDLQIWQDNYGRTAPPDLTSLGDADGDGDVDGRDFLIIQERWGMSGALMANLATVPEPSAMVLMFCAAMGLLGRRKNSRQM